MVKIISKLDISNNDLNAGRRYEHSFDQIDKILFPPPHRFGGSEATQPLAGLPTYMTAKGRHLSGNGFCGARPYRGSASR